MSHINISEYKIWMQDHGVKSGYSGYARDIFDMRNGILGNYLDIKIQEAKIAFDDEAVRDLINTNSLFGIDIFEIDDVSTLIQNLKKFDEIFFGKFNPTAFKTYNKDVGHNRPRAAFRKYLEYLENTAKNDTNIIVTNGVSQSEHRILKAKKPLFRDLTLNTILFGPPGTGKTYNTINKAIAIANPLFDLSQERMKIKEEFERLMKEGQVVFSTFHQSMSYEDFIEGIKPVEPEKDGDPVIYRIEEGIFRRICIDAAFAIAQLQETKSTEEVLDFSIMYDRFIEMVEEKILIGKKVELETKSGGTVLVESISQQGNFIIKHHDGTRTYTVSKARLTKLQSVIKDLNEVSNINDKFRGIIGGSNSSAYWSVLNAIKKEKLTKTVHNEPRTYSFEDRKEVVRSLSGSDFLNKSGKPYVLIIDEINRGNVSQIFGELITLIEEDKRLGREEALEVILPYSKERFGVPSNLYIIGTMNTADRSVEAIDTALRRRFSFEEMQPNPKLIATHGKLKESNGVVDSIDLPLLLKILNSRIEKLMDKDHQIGHSYFMAVTNLKELKNAFQNKIIPLLQEYFFGDFGKIGLVIGKGFFEPVDDSNENIFADFGEYSASEFAERVIYKIKKTDDMTDMDFTIAIHFLLKK